MWPMIVTNGFPAARITRSVWAARSKRNWPWMLPMMEIEAAQHLVWVVE
jgi:hypothetical protein